MLRARIVLRAGAPHVPPRECRLATLATQAHRPLPRKTIMSTKRILLGVAILAPLSLGTLALPGSTSREETLAPAPEAVEYGVDATHSSAIFKVKHFGAAWFYGRFNEISGTLQVDEKNVADSYVMINIKGLSVDTKNQKLDDHIRSPDFLDARQFPDIVFESKKVAKGKDKGTYQVDGTLTLRGVSKPLSVTVEKVGSGRDGQVVGYHTRFTIDRTDFGVSYGAANGSVGKDVELTISIEGHRKD